MSAVEIYPNVRAYSGAFKSDVVQTTNATATVLYTLPIPDRCTLTIEARFYAYSSVGVLSSRFLRTATFKRNSTITQCNATQSPVTDDESNGSTSCNFLISAGIGVQPRGVGLAATTFNWQVRGHLWVLMWP